MSITQLQAESVAAILAAGEQGRRAASFGHTLLNRKARVLRGIRKNYERRALALGVSQAALVAHWNDIRDMALLEASADE